MVTGFTLEEIKKEIDYRKRKIESHKKFIDDPELKGWIDFNKEAIKDHKEQLRRYKKLALKEHGVKL